MSAWSMWDDASLYREWTYTVGKGSRSNPHRTLTIMAGPTWQDALRAIEDRHHAGIRVVDLYESEPTVAWPYPRTSPPVGRWPGLRRRRWPGAWPHVDARCVLQAR